MAATIPAIMAERCTPRLLLKALFVFDGATPLFPVVAFARDVSFDGVDAVLEFLDGFRVGLLQRFCISPNSSNVAIMLFS